MAGGGGLDKSGHVFPIHSVTAIHPRFHNNIINLRGTPGVRDNFGIFAKLNLPAKKVQAGNFKLPKTHEIEPLRG